MRPSKSITDLISCISSISHNDWERARGAYEWIRDNITFDNDTNTNINPVEGAFNYSAEGVFKRKKGICGGIVNLYTALARGLGLQVQGIGGNTTNYGHREWQGFNPITSHAWNAVS